ncbi:hypothetical protein NUW54_g14234 [Trametes sanguinea]|uniref:Uncharacterized protein n=1 Tax=Trametes sanguinea TaxID=158606 RepID=A0ACC1MFR9_9APHY|nr:hypothetical protein NUW54_g14234 [Trametes sanguinea]
MSSSKTFNPEETYEVAKLQVATRSCCYQGETRGFVPGVRAEEEDPCLLRIASSARKDILEDHSAGTYVHLMGLRYL